MRIAQIAPLAESVPPKLYGGTERVVAWLVDELVELGHDVTLFASGDLTRVQSSIRYGRARWPRRTSTGSIGAGSALASKSASRQTGWPRPTNSITGSCCIGSTDCRLERSSAKSPLRSEAEALTRPYAMQELPAQDT
jgi:hypothetical protein